MESAEIADGELAMLLKCEKCDAWQGSPRHELADSMAVDVGSALSPKMRRQLPTPAARQGLAKASDVAVAELPFSPPKRLADRLALASPQKEAVLLMESAAASPLKEAALQKEDKGSVSPKRERAPFRPPEEQSSVSPKRERGAKERGGDIKVFARFRPLGEDESPNDDVECIDFGADRTTCMVHGQEAAATEQQQRERVFTFSAVFPPSATQQDIYKDVGQVAVKNVLAGHTGAIIAYGRTGSGKTHTMLGSGSAEHTGDGEGSQLLGLVPKALLELQASVASSQDVIELRVSLVEVYQERVIDLLTPSARDVNQEFRHDKHMGLVLPGVAEVPVETAAHAMEIMTKGCQHRSQAVTNMNANSSRSHAIFIVTAINAAAPAWQRRAQLFLVDLAGSERTQRTHCRGAQLEEAKMINRSLLSLGRVIEHLASGARKHVPYRDSKLTQLLKTALGPNSETSVIITASTHRVDIEETLSSLRFGCRVTKVQTRSATDVRAQHLKERMRKKLQDLQCICRQLEVESRSSSSTRSDLSQLSQLSQSSFREVENELIRSGTGLRLWSSEARSQCLARRVFVRELLPSLLCPIEQAVMQDPVLAADGYCYERRAIERLLSQTQASPVSGVPMMSQLVIENRALRDQIKLHAVNLPPLGQRVPDMSRLTIHQMYHILSYLDVGSFSTLLPVSVDFLALASSPCLWQKRLFIF